MAVCEINVDEIRHFHQRRTALGTAADIVTSAISSGTATPGEIRTITREEIEASWGKRQLKEP